jgi:acetyl esterase/lipase
MKFIMSTILLAMVVSSYTNADIIPAQQASYDEFPNSTVHVEGIEELKAHHTIRSFKLVNNVVYAHKSDMDLHLTIIKPVLKESNGEESKTTRFPIVIYVQGSAWFKQNMGNEVAQLSRFADRGYIVALVEYRPSTVAPFPAQVEDAKSAIRFMIEHGEEYYGDPEKLVVWGDSSGGHTASMVGTTLDTRDFDTLEGEPIKLKAVIDYYGPTAIWKMNEEPSTYDHIQPNSPEGMLLGGKNVLNHIEAAKKTSPMTYISSSESMPPFLIVHGDKDRLVPFGQSVMLFDALKKNQHDVRMIKLHGGDHGGAPYWQDDVLDIVDNFIKATL